MGQVAICLVNGWPVLGLYDGNATPSPSKDMALMLSR